MRFWIDRVQELGRPVPEPEASVRCRDDRSQARPGFMPTLAIMRTRAEDISREVEAACATPHSRPHRESVTLDSMHSASCVPRPPQATSAAMLAPATMIGLQRASAPRESTLKRALEGRWPRTVTSDEPASVLLERIRAARERELSGREPRIRRSPVDLFVNSHAPPAPHTVVL